ncbi:hypothetical protein M427DRAFT_57973 [Gonapodya prolifera JEL478]|uniref:Uncharacterized protein n=1 Tax=Gonapodya prolifera (strain JEL478) TaxID=1344416 RepID=A0A139ABV9_GONPJ|nr:hypothetical protein M427DRAFT_57973 [Gonapodya prolifera JEL478]|eukprot:KXS13965.1 hypothetical protein M427DRAFT_57973 [Gonapodya prolifera JEL478]
MVKSGSLKNLNRSPIAEIGNTQIHFMNMLKVFAEALQSNRSLMHGGKASASASNKAGGTGTGGGGLKSSQDFNRSVAMDA